MTRFPYFIYDIFLILLAAQVFNALNALELKSLEEPLYLFGQFFKNPAACLTLGEMNELLKLIYELQEFRFSSYLYYQLSPKKVQRNMETV